MNAKLRGHTPRLVNTVTKREMCEVCGVSWLRGRPPLGPCPGIERAETPALGNAEALRGGLYRGTTKDNT